MKKKLLHSSDYNQHQTQHQAPGATANPSFLKPYINPYAVDVRGGSGSDGHQCN